MDFDLLITISLTLNEVLDISGFFSNISLLKWIEGKKNVYDHSCPLASNIYFS